MPNFLVGVVAAFLEPVLHGWSNHIDAHFSNTVFPKFPVLLFFGTVLNIVFLPIIFLFDPPGIVPMNLIGFVFLIALIDVIFLFPYYWALTHADTSIVVALASTGKIFVPILAYFLIGEQLLWQQYVGFFLIVISASLLTFNLKQFKFNRAFYLMLFVSLILAIQTITYKHVFDSGATWGSVVLALTAMEVVIAAVIMFLTTKLSEIIDDFRKIIQNWKLFVAQQGLEWGGNMGNSFAVSILPVSVTQAIMSTQPFFVLIYAVLFARWFPGFKEETSKAEIVRKSILFLLTIIGTVLIVVYSASTITS